MSDLPLLIPALIAASLLMLAAVRLWRLAHPWWLGQKIMVGGEERTITRYGGSVVTIDKPWSTAPGSADEVLFPSRPSQSD